VKRFTQEEFDMPIPEELKLLRQWTYSFSEAELKRPTHYHYEPDGALPFDDAVAKAGVNRSYGLYVTKSDPYVIGDIDHVNPNNPFYQLPISLVNLLRTHPTYCEESPSAHGLHFVYKLQNFSDKDSASGFYFKNREKMGECEDPNCPKRKVDKENTREAQVNIGPPWMRFTGKEVHFSTGQIALITIDQLKDAFNFRDEAIKSKALANVSVDMTALPAFAEVATVIKSLPLDQNPRIRRAHESTFMETYSHYGYWLKVLMTVHNYAELTNKLSECLSLMVEWSSTDVASYQGEEDVHKHWRSFSQGDGYISYKSLFKLAVKYRLFWPRPRKRKENEPFLPLITEYVNFKALVDYYAIRLYRDEQNPNIVYISADLDIAYKYFMMFGVREWYGKYFGPFTRDTLIPALYKLCQDKGFIGIGHNILLQFVKTYLAETTDAIHLVKLYFDTPFNRLPEKYRENAEHYHNSTIDSLYEALDIDYVSKTEAEKEDEERLYYTYYKSWVMGLVRNLYIRDTPHMNNCILLLTGPEQIRKTSHFKYILPKFLREDNIAFTTHGFRKEESMRDVIKLSSSNLLIVWDEIEQYLDAETESNFKKVIDNNPQKIIDKYEVIEKTVIPRAVYGGTSNQREFKLGAEGSRRLFHIPVKWVDTEHMETNICWHALINNLKTEMFLSIKSGQVPWLLTEDQLQLQRIYHSKIRSKNSIDLALEEIFEWEIPFTLYDGGHIPGVSSLQDTKTKRVMSTRDVCDVLTAYGFGALASKRPAVIRSVERICSEYTGTQRNEVVLLQPKCMVKRGLAIQGQHKRWVMPPMRKGLRGEMFKMFNQPEE
jgi:hypothetical protein